MAIGVSFVADSYNMIRCSIMQCSGLFSHSNKLFAFAVSAI